MTTAILVLVRTLHMGSAMLLVALSFFIVFVLAPARGTGSSDSEALFYGRAIRWLWAAWLIEAVSGLLWFYGVAGQMMDEPSGRILNQSDLGSVLWQTQFGRLWLNRAVVEGALGIVLYLASRKTTPVTSGARFSMGLLLVVSGGLLVSLAWAGHAASGVHQKTLHVFVDALHLFCGAIWPVGLIPLSLYLWKTRNGGRGVPDEMAIRTVRRFSQASFVAVLVLVVSGTINGWLMIGSWVALPTTFYGSLLLGKVGVVVIMLGLGVFNRLYLLPRLETEPVHFHQLWKTILAESGLALVVLLIVGTMGMTPPPA